jgi:putative transposase
VRDWLKKVGVKTLYIEPGSPWENGYIESFNGKLQDELLKREVFYTLKEAKVHIERWRDQYIRVRPHNSLGYRAPAPEAILAGSGSAPPDPASTENQRFANTGTGTKTGLRSIGPLTSESKNPKIREDLEPQE